MIRFRDWEITALLFSLFVALSWIDAITTQYALSFGAVEMNPFLAPFVGTAHTFLIVKMAGVAIVLGLALVARSFHRAGSTAVVTAACMGAAIPVIWNIRILLTFITVG
ncbi:MAG: DUF5658 family protein [Methanomicrobiales archaeon]|nr:DUF5658 family protein [Methanomicrobiales archaeon]